MKSKLTSRKFWAAVVGVIIGIALAFGVDGDTITNVAGAITSMASIVVYILAEASVDKASATTNDLTINNTYNGTNLTGLAESEGDE